MYTELLHLVTLHHLRKFREVVLTDKLRLEFPRVDSLSLCIVSFNPYPLFASLSCAPQTPSLSVWFPCPLSGSLSFAYPPSQYHSAERAACKLCCLLLLMSLRPPHLNIQMVCTYRYSTQTHWLKRGCWGKKLIFLHDVFNPNKCIS